MTSSVQGEREGLRCRQGQGQEIKKGGRETRTRGSKLKAGTGVSMDEL